MHRKFARSFGANWQTHTLATHSLASHLMSNIPASLDDRPEAFAWLRGWQGATVIVSIAFCGLLWTNRAESPVWQHLTSSTIMDVSETISGSYTPTTPDGRRIDWLAIRLFHYTFNLAGITGVNALRIAVSLAAFLLTYRLLRRRIDNSLVVLTLGTVLLTASLKWTQASPPIFGQLLMAIVCLLCAGWEDQPSWRVGWLVPIFAVWANLDGSFLFGLAALGCFAVLHPLDAMDSESEPQPRLIRHLTSWGLLWGAAFGATLLNPAGIELHLRLLSTLVPSARYLPEHQPLWFSADTPVLVWAGLLLMLSAYLTAHRQRTLSSVAILFLATGMMLFRAELAVMSLMLLVWQTAIFCEEAWDSILSNAKQLPVSTTIAPPKKWRSSLVWLPVIGLLMVACSLRQAGVLRTESQRLPLESVAYMQKAGVGGNVLAPYYWGDFIRWNLPGKVNVAIDSRMLTTFPEWVAKSELELRRGTPGWSVLVDDVDSHWILLPVGCPSIEHLRNRSDWAQRHSDSVAVVFEKTALVTAALQNRS